MHSDGVRSSFSLCILFHWLWWLFHQARASACLYVCLSVCQREVVTEAFAIRVVHKKVQRIICNRIIGALWNTPAPLKLHYFVVFAWEECADGPRFRRNMLSELCFAVNGSQKYNYPSQIIVFPLSLTFAVCLLRLCHSVQQITQYNGIYSSFFSRSFSSISSEKNELVRNIVWRNTIPNHRKNHRLQQIQKIRTIKTGSKADRPTDRQTEWQGRQYPRKIEPIKLRESCNRNIFLMATATAATTLHQPQQQQQPEESESRIVRSETPKIENEKRNVIRLSPTTKRRPKG